MATIRSLFLVALPIFVGICLLASLLEVSGALNFLVDTVGKGMVIFNLPAEAALAVAMGAIRKDGLAIGLLDSDWGSLKVALESPSQILTAVYLAGVLLPCLVTLMTIGREMGGRFALRLAVRQAAWAAAFSIAIAWGGALLGTYL
ncbi:MAG: nucleoside recognition domain-containing protein [Verrucomicrobiota bacterium]